MKLCVSHEHREQNAGLFNPPKRLRSSIIDEDSGWSKNALGRGSEFGSWAITVGVGISASEFWELWTTYALYKWD